MSNLTLLLLLLLLPLFPSLLLHTVAQRSSAGDLWCVAKNNAEDSALQSAIDWACGPGGANCQPIQQGGVCFQSGDLQSQASYAFNDYFVKSGGSGSACDFSGTAALTRMNPGNGECIFQPSSEKNGNSSMAATYGSTTGLGPSFDLNSGSCLNLDRLLWVVGLIVSVFLLIFFEK